MYQRVIDTAFEKKPSDFDALLNLMTEAGCEVKRRGKSISLRYKDKPGYIRFSSLGEGYSEAELLAVLAGEQEHTPRRKRAQAAPKKVSLLIDIDAKMREGKGMGYKNWASKSNAQRMADTMAFLHENKLMDYAELTEKADAVTARFNALSAQIKSAETRMAEIAVLKKQIINYAKTREVFDGYKKSRYSKKYLAEHEADIILHRAAKKAFNELGVTKLPTVKSLQEEYAKLLSEKKAAYPEYQQARKEMQRLLPIKANVDRILGEDTREAEKGKEQERY